MTDKIRSQVSAYLDDELLEAESELLVRRLCSDHELRRTAARYSLIGGVLRGSVQATGTDLGQRIMAAIDGDEMPVAAAAEVSRRTSRWLRPLAGGAIAATVAALAVFVVRDPVIAPGVGVAPATIAEIAEPVTEPAYTVPARVAARPVSGNNVRLNQLLVRHSQYSTTMGGQGIMTYRTVGFDSGEAPQPTDDSDAPTE